MRKLFTVTALLMGFAVPAFAQVEPREYACGRQLEDANGKVSTVPDPSLRIIEMTRSGPFTPPPPPAGQTVVSYFCLRSELVPAVNDWKVLEHLVPFMIAADIDGERQSLFLEMENGRLRVRVRASLLTDDQRARVTEFLNTSQEHFYKK